MTMRNDLDRSHLFADVIDRAPGLAAGAAHLKQMVPDKLVEHNEYIREHGQDLPEIRTWAWPS